MSITAEQISKKNLSLDDTKIHIKTLIDKVNEAILRHPAEYGPNIVQFTFPNSISNVVLRIYIYTEVCKDFLARGFDVRFHPQKTGNQLIIKWYVEIPKAALGQMVDYLKALTVDENGYRKFVTD